MVHIARDHNGTTGDAAGLTSRPAAVSPDAAGHQPPGVESSAPGGHAVPRGDESDRVSPLGSEARSATAARYLLAALRLGLGWIFLWAFLDKVFGWGFATPASKAWIDGGNPTKGFLGSARGPFSDFYQSLAGTGAANVLFMGGLLAIGVALTLGIGMRLAAAGGTVLLVMMWTAVLPPTNNPFLDDHLVYAAVLVVLALLGAGNTVGLGRAWAALPLVQRIGWLR